MTCALQTEPIPPAGYVPAGHPVPPPEVAPLAAELSPSETARALNERACALLYAGALDAAEAACAAAMEIADAPGERWRTLVNLGVLAALRGDEEMALRWIGEAETRVPQGDAYARLLVLVNRSQALMALGELPQAEEAAAAALRLGRRERDDHWAALGGLALGLVHLARGLRNQARARLGEAARGFARAGDVLRQVQCHYALGEIAYDSDDPIRAGAHYRDGLALARQAAAVDVVELLTLRFEHR
jgi:tetratricopeptide (TPR) repeat protein